MKRVRLSVVFLLVTTFIGGNYALAQFYKPAVQIYGEFKGGTACVEITPGMTVLDAVEIAGGFTPFSQKSEVILLRVGPGGQNLKTRFEE